MRVQETFAQRIGRTREPCSWPTGVRGVTLLGGVTCAEVFWPSRDRSYVVGSHKHSCARHLQSTRRLRLPACLHLSGLLATCL
jgi:hypothetical protein